MVEEHFRMYRDRYVKQYSRRAVCVENAEDIVQNAYLMALTYINTYDSSQPFNAWFSKIVHNEFLKWRRDYMLNGMTVEIDEEEHFEPVRMSEYLHNIVDDIKGARPPFDEVFELIFVKNFSMNAASELTGVQYMKVVRAVHRFKERMKKKYK